MLTGMAGNMTLASLNTPYSPTSPAKPSSWSFGAASVAHIYDDFQSNVSLKVPHGLSQAGAPTGLGIIYPTDEQKEQQEGTAGSLKRGSSHDMAYKHRTSMRTETIYYDSQFDFGSRVLEDTAPEPLNFSSLLYPTELSPRILDLISEEPVIETIQDSAFLVATSESSPLVSNEAQEKWILQRILEASGHSIESLSAELKARSRGIYYRFLGESTDLPCNVQTTSLPTRIPAIGRQTYNLTPLILKMLFFVSVIPLFLVLILPTSWHRSQYLSLF